MKAKITPGLVLRATCESGKDRLYVWDSELKGFGLMVTAGGARSFCVQYRADRRSRRMTIPASLPLSEARREAKKILGEVARGGDPAASKRAAQEGSFRQVAERYLTSRAARSLRSIDERRSILERLVYPKLGARPIEAIRRSEIAVLLEQIGDRNGPRMCGYAGSILQIVFHWHERQSDLFVSPMVRGMVPSGIVARDRVLTDLELQAFWRAAASWEHPFGRLAQICLLTGARHGEAAGMKHGEIVDGIWTIPAERYKTKVSHAIPLSRAALDVIASCPVLGEKGFVFSVSGRTSASQSQSKKRLDDRMRAELARLDPAAKFERWTIHDLRRTARTLMSRAGISSDVAERALGHKIGGVRGIYDKHHFLSEKRHAFEALAALVERIVCPQENVVALARSPT